MRFCKSNPSNNANSENYPSKYVILEITAFLLLRTLKKVKGKESDERDI